MARVHVFGDESGDFAFNRRQGVSTYFYVATATIPEESTICSDLTDLRAQFLWSGIDIEYFHAQTDTREVKAAVYDVIAKHPEVRLDVTLLRKDRAYERVRKTNGRFWKTGWYFHMRAVTPSIVSKDDTLWVSAASLETKITPGVLREELRDVLDQVAPCTHHHSVWHASAHIGLQVADYCGWAVQRKWEQKKTDAYDIISSQLVREYPLFGR